LPELTAAEFAAAVRALPAEAAGDSRAVWRALGKVGLLAALYEGEPGDPATAHGPRPERLGALLAELDARHALGVVLAACVQIATALPILREHATGGPIAAAYRSAVRGESLLALAATDTGGAGSDLMSLGTTAELSREHVLLDGEKPWITNACTADHALVLARHRPQRHFTSFLWVLVPTSADGVTVTPAPSALFEGAGLGRLSFRRVVLGRDHVVGAPGRGLSTFARHIATERLAGALWAAALSRRVLAETHRRLVVRPLGDGVMWDNAVIRQQFARCLVETWRMDASCASHRADDGDALVSSMLLKAAVAESLDKVLGECVQLVGAEAFVTDGFAQLRAETGMFGIAGGAAGAMLAGIADHAIELLGRCRR
jgi:acyl-CoA dehydrogenase